MLNWEKQAAGYYGNSHASNDFGPIMKTYRGILLI